jgi:DNA-binding MarR family transcriptional regulator
MADSKASNDYEIVWLIRSLFRALGQKATENLSDLGVSVADRAVMEFLYPDERLSVPEIAERYKVSRQHVQVTVNTLLDAKLLATRENPRHKRSAHIVLTADGKSLFRKIRERDMKLVTQIFSSIPARDKRITQETLAALLSQLT